MSDAIEWVEAKVASGDLTVGELAMLVPFAQRELGVDDDGKPGRGTMRALQEAQAKRCVIPSGTTPIPKGRKELVQVYGDPSWVKLPRGRAVDLDDAWEHANIRSFKLHTGKRVRMHRLVGDEFVRLFREACEASGYTPKSVQTYNPRVIGGTDRLSTHAYGIAFDVDPSRNPWGGVASAPLRQHPEFVEVFESAGWCWGGRWKKGKGDDMHFQRAMP